MIIVLAVTELCFFCVFVVVAHLKFMAGGGMKFLKKQRLVPFTYLKGVLCFLRWFIYVTGNTKVTGCYIIFLLLSVHFAVVLGRRSPE